MKLSIECFNGECISFEDGAAKLKKAKVIYEDDSRILHYTLVPHVIKKDDGKIEATLMLKMTRVIENKTDCHYGKTKRKALSYLGIFLQRLLRKRRHIL